MTPSQEKIVCAMYGKSMLEIARVLGVSPNTALRWCKRLGVKTIGKGNRRPGVIRVGSLGRARSVFELGESCSVST